MDEVAEGAVALPAPALRPFVGWYTGYRQVGVAPGTHRGLPSPYLTMILTLDDLLDMAAHPDPAQPAGRFEALVGGLHTAPAVIRHAGRQSGVQVALTPWGARALLGPPAGRLASVDVHAGPSAGEVRTAPLTSGSPAIDFCVDVDHTLALTAKTGSGDARTKDVALAARASCVISTAGSPPPIRSGMRPTARVAPR